MNATKVTRTSALAGLVPAGKLGCSYRVLLPVLALCVATAGLSQPPRILRGPGVPPNMLGGFQQTKPAAIPAFAQYRFLTIDIPNSTGAVANGINNAGMVTGWYTDASYTAHGFTWQNGTLQTVDYSGALGTYLNGVNNQGVAAGYYLDVNYDAHAVTYSVPSGAWSVLPDIPNYSANEGYGINDAGVAVGYALAPFGYLAWIWYPTITAYSFFTVPGANPAGTNPTAINDQGKVVGEFFDVASRAGYAFLKEGDTYTTIEVTGALATYALGINNSGTIAGWFFSADYYELGFVRTIGGVFTFVNFPGSAGETALGGINDEGDICGYWYNSAFVQQAFVASPE
jgi:probable HAF family extracellular repeat protein